tara:strand:- start:199 stop:1254 length:1056 start_codon:yes stop_codon:yes gene_type:complete
MVEINENIDIKTPNMCRWLQENTDSTSKNLQQIIENCKDTLNCSESLPSQSSDHEYQHSPENLSTPDSDKSQLEEEIQELDNLIDELLNFKLKWEVLDEITEIIPTFHFENLSIINFDNENNSVENNPPGFKIRIGKCTDKDSIIIEAGSMGLDFTLSDEMIQNKNIIIYFYHLGWIMHSKPISLINICNKSTIKIPKIDDNTQLMIHRCINALHITKEFPDDILSNEIIYNRIYVQKYEKYFPPFYWSVNKQIRREIEPWLLQYIEDIELYNLYTEFIAKIPELDIYDIRKITGDIQNYIIYDKFCQKSLIKYYSLKLNPSERKILLEVLETKHFDPKTKKCLILNHNLY